MINIKMISRAISLVLLLHCSPSHAQATFDVSQLKFNSIFAARAGEKFGYCLLGTGFFRSIRSDNVDELVSSWLTSHSHSEVIPVGVLGSYGKPRSIVYVWVQSGDESLNTYLIREGAFPGGVMIDAVDFNRIRGTVNANIADENAPHRFVSAEQYDEFIKHVIEAEALAKSEKKGVWSDQYKEIREHTGIQ